MNRLCKYLTIALFGFMIIGPTILIYNTMMESRMPLFIEGEVIRVESNRAVDWLDNETGGVLASYKIIICDNKSFDIFCGISEYKRIKTGDIVKGLRRDKRYYYWSHEKGPLHVQ